MSILPARLPVRERVALANRVAPAIAVPIFNACREASVNLGGPSLQSLGVTSAVRREGRTSVALAMALVLAREYGRRVLLVEMDGFDRPSMADRTGVTPSPGLGEYLEGRCSLPDTMQTVTAGLTVITSGAPVAGVLRLLRQSLAAGLMTEMSQGHDVVVADLPPLLEGPFTNLAAREFGSLVVVVRASATRVEQLNHALSGLTIEPSLLLNGETSRIPEWLRRLIGI